MGVRERRDRDKAATRKLILGAARELFVREGREGLTMRRLAEQIEYSPTAIYVHFDDKEALLTELSICDFRAFTDSFVDIPRDVPPLDRLRLLAAAYVRFATDNPSQYRHLFMTPRPLSAEVLAAKPEEDAYDILLGAVTGAQRAGVFHPSHTDPHLVAQALWCALHGVVALHQTLPEGAGVPMRPVEELAFEVSDRLIEGFQRPRG